MEIATPIFLNQTACQLFILNYNDFLTMTGHKKKETKGWMEAKLADGKANEQSILVPSWHIQCVLAYGCCCCCWYEPILLC